MLLALSGINEHPPGDAIRPCEHQPDLEMCRFLVAVGVGDCVTHWQKCVYLFAIYCLLLTSLGRDHGWHLIICLSVIT